VRLVSKNIFFYSEKLSSLLQPWRSMYAVVNYATRFLVRFESKNIFFYSEKLSSLLQPWRSMQFANYATSFLVHFESKNIFFYSEKRSSLVQLWCSNLRIRGIGSRKKLAQIKNQVSGLRLQPSYRQPFYLNELL
jgi:hypothetical protein